MPEQGGWVYIMSNQPNGVLYVGVAGDLTRRLAEHRADEIDGFPRKYGVKLLVYFERFEEMSKAIARQKVIKHWYRMQKLRIITDRNADWEDLSDRVL